MGGDVGPRGQRALRLSGLSSAIERPAGTTSGKGPSSVAVVEMPKQQEPAAPQSGHLAWHRIEVDGRVAQYGEGGSGGPTVVFLHGWGLGSRAYKRAVGRLIARGCRVFAPSLPSFGGTADLLPSQMSMAGYADWVAAFMAAVGIDEPALLIGHSFGGGVAINVADRHGALVSYLVLLNAVGGVASRPPWVWASAFGRELWPVPQAVDMLRAMRDDVVPNIIRNPLGMARAARVAQRADLGPELASLRARGVPVLVLTSDGDSIIPRGAFDALCDALSTDGRVVHGGHSWLLADPDAFDEVLGSIVDLQVAEHRTARAPGRAEEVRRLLRGTAVPARTARAMVRNASPLWLMSDDASVLAAQIALCHPKLRPGEVRAVARPVEGSASVRLTTVAADRRGLLADCAAVLAANGLSIAQASGTMWPRPRVALLSYLLPDGAKVDTAGWAALGDDLRAMVASGSPPPASWRPIGPVRIDVHGSGAGRSLVEIIARDQVGLLSVLCRCFADLGCDIEAVSARTVNGVAHDTFLVTGDLDEETVSASLDAVSGPV